MEEKYEDGYLVVASKHHNFYLSAVNLLQTIKDYYPEANTCLVTEERFVDDRSDFIDHVIYCDKHYRAKLWGMANSPFTKRTFYIDADMECMHEDISEVFDELGNHDMMFTGLPRDRWHIFMDTEFPGGTFTLAGAVCLYDSSNKLVMEFMQDWYDIYVKQYAREWWPLDKDGEFDKINYPYHLRVWDQFTLWWLTNKSDKYKELKVGIFEDDLRWNYWSTLLKEFHKPQFQPKKEMVLLHHSAGFEKKKNFNKDFED
jgi:hypothetical protein